MLKTKYCFLYIPIKLYENSYDTQLVQKIISKNYTEKKSFQNIFGKSKKTL